MIKDWLDKKRVLIIWQNIMISFRLLYGHKFLTIIKLLIKSYKCLMQAIWRAILCQTCAMYFVLYFYNQINSKHNYKIVG